MSTSRLLTLACYLPVEGAFFAAATQDEPPEPGKRRMATAAETAAYFGMAMPPEVS